jgi:hypothetical protein
MKPIRPGAGLVLIALLALPSCSVINPPELEDYTDKGVVEWSQATMRHWGKDSSVSDGVGYGGAISLAGLSTGTLLAAAGRSPAAPGLAMGSALLSWVLAIAKPTGHGNAILAGYIMMTKAWNEYFASLTSAGISTVPDKCMTAQGGIFAGRIAMARAKVASLSQELDPPDPQLPTATAPAGARQLGATQPNTCGK